MDVVVAAEAIDLLPGALGSRLHMPASFVGTDEVTFALGADPFAIDGVVFKPFKIGLCRLGCGADGRRLKLIRRAGSCVSDKNGFLR